MAASILKQDQHTQKFKQNADFLKLLDNAKQCNVLWNRCVFWSCYFWRSGLKCDMLDAR